MDYSFIAGKLKTMGARIRPIGNSVYMIFQKLARVIEVCIAFAVLASFLLLMLWPGFFVRNLLPVVDETQQPGMPCMTNTKLTNSFNLGFLSVDVDSYNKVCATYELGKTSFISGGQLLHSDDPDVRRAGADLQFIGLDTIKSVLPHVSVSVDDYIQFTESNPAIFEVMKAGNRCEYATVTQGGKSGFAYLCEPKGATETQPTDRP
ncbi:hypothetical protein FVA81_07725 [Rhizobium sp. WL3]|uniref:hypothetical protein n=1 Tax=Rhizobium sp. WL3 TaxID=2603277 RepID=UPI0011C1EE93|nr:hypothetical protein [Rhizobium sp. WL3]QEE44506.1 hypothetical protein FVA81_07725 [Rhizobium sp. WL3]